MRATPLETIEGSHNAEMGDDAGWRMPLSFGDLAREAAAVRDGVGVADVSNWGTFTLEGRNAVKFLQGLVTNDVAALAADTGCYAAFLNVHGRIEAVAHIFSFGDNRLALRTPPEATDWIASSLGRFRLAGGFDLTQLEGYAGVAVNGPEAGLALADCLEARLDGPLRLRCSESEFEGATVRILGVPRTEADGADVVGPPAAVASLVERLLAWRGGAARPVGGAALEVLRMEAGLPRFGTDFDADTVLQEVDVPEIVNFNKGCYLGQEIVARIHFQGQPSKLLRRLVLEPGAETPRAGDDLVADDVGKVAGRVTSALVSPTVGPIVFAIVKRKYYGIGTPLRIRRGDALVPAVVAPRGPARRVEEAV